ncbi:MAG: Metalloenzyme, LuxS/M16 peptidase-like protein, partial [Piptocephalis tieghemiana]
EVSANDNRHYRYIQLPNKLRALLISDPDTDNAAAALDVRVGSLFDPPKLEGLAHFCEHMLFLGTDKYPQENAYGQYLAEHGGHSNAYTGLENTNYYFEVSHGALEGALDRFARFFVAPRFDASCTERELMAVDSEHRKNLQSDGWREFQLERTLSSPDHPYSQFSTGNVETLRTRPAAEGIDVRKALLDFHDQYYSANIMRLVIVGRDSLDTLMEWTVSKFSEVPNKDIDPPVTKGLPYTDRELMREIRLKPVRDSRSLEISWPIEDQAGFYRTQPERYITHLLGHEGGGSILSLLKRKGWANYLSAGCTGGARGFDFLQVDIDLTEKGLEHYEDVAAIVFQYLRLMRESGVQEWIFEEVRKLAEIRFRFQEKGSVSGYASRVASLAQQPYAPEHLLSGYFLVRDYDETLLNRTLNSLQPDRFWMTLKGQRLPLGPNVQKEEWYGTEYSVKPVSQPLRDRLARISRGEDKEALELHLPRPNEFIPTRFETAKPVAKDPGSPAPPMPKPLRHPQLVENSGPDGTGIRLWHKRDDQFWVPKVYVWAWIRTPLAYASPRTSVLTRLYAELVRDALNEYSYDAEVAGLSWSIHTDVDGLVLSLEGYNDRMPVLLQKVIQGLREFRPSPERFDLIREQLLRVYRNFSKEAPYQHALYHLTTLTQERMWTHPEKVEELERIQDPKIVEEFVHSVLLQQLQVEMLVVGNVSRKEARSWGDLVTQGLGASSESLGSKPSYSPLFPSQCPGMRAILLPEGPHRRWVYERTVEAPEEVNSAIEWYAQVGDATDRKAQVIVGMIAQVAQEPCFDQLRTKEQLGYLVFSGPKLTPGTVGFRVIVQSARTAQYVESRIEAFLTQLTKVIEEMGEEEWGRHVAALISRKTEKDKHLMQEANRYWDHVHSGYYDFLQTEEQVALLKTITKEEVLSMFRERVDPTSPTLKKLSVRMEVHKSPEK